MANIILHKRNSTPGTVPTSGALSQGELGINIGDGKLYTKNSGNNIINLGVTSISGTTITPASGYLQTIAFNTNVEPDLLKGQVCWNDTDGTLNLAVTDNTDIHVGEHSFFRVRNSTSTTLYKGQAVYASGVHSNGIINPALYSANDTIREVRFMGLMLEDLNNNNNGYAIQFGHINIDTRGNGATNGASNIWSATEPAWSGGDILYVSDTNPGKLTKVEPKHSISVAIVLNAASNGLLFVRPTSYGHLNDNHDVSVSGATNGQFLQYNSSTDYWVPSSSGNFSTLLVNGTGVSVTGHTHTSSDITNFNSSVSGLLPTGTANYLSKFGANGSGLGNSLVFDNGTNVGIGTTSPSVQLDVVGSGRFRGRCRVDNLTINTDTTTDNTSSYLATMLLGSDGASLSGGGLQITSNTNRDANKALLGLVNHKLKTLSGGSTSAKTTFSSEYNADTSVASTQSPNGNFVNVLTLESGNLTLINQNLYIKNAPTPTAYDNSAGDIINSQAYIYMQGASAGSPARFNNVYNYYSRGQFATSHSYANNFIDFYAAPIVGQTVPSGIITTRTALLIDYYNGNTAHITNPRGIWQLGSNVTNHLAGNLGIGTSSPSSRLSIGGSIDATSVGSTGLSIQTLHFSNTTNGLTNTALSVNPTFSTVNSNVSNTYGLLISPLHSGTYTTTNHYSLYVNASTLITGVLNNNYAAIFMGGNVGIGTAAPSARLEVAASGTTSLDVAHFSNSNGVEKAKVSLSSAGDGTFSVIDASNNTDIFLTSNASTASYINAGNVGIGLTNPAEKLEIDGSLKFANCSSRILRGDNNNIRLSSGGSAPGHFGMLIDNTGTTNGRIFRLASWADGTTGKFIIRDDTAGTDRLVIQANGTIGIGTDTPTERLHVSGSQTTIRLNNSLSYDTQLRLTDIASDWSVGVNQGNSLGSGVFSIRSVTAGASRLVIDTNGNVGIGTITPSDKLNVIGNISAGTLSTTQGKFIAYGSASQPNLLFEGFDATGKARISTNSGANRQLKIENDGASNTLGLYVEGDVGIGTDTPTYKLQVNGSFAASTKSFRIHHPSKSGWNLEYGSLESPYHGVRLTGRGQVVKGVGAVVLPVYLKDLIHDDDTLNIQITNIKHGKTIYLEKIDLQNDQFIVKVDRAKSLGELQFCWTLTGVRKDVDHLVVEKEN